MSFCYYRLQLCIALLLQASTLSLTLSPWMYFAIFESSDFLTWTDVALLALSTKTLACHTTYMLFLFQTNAGGSHKQDEINLGKTIANKCAPRPTYHGASPSNPNNIPKNTKEGRSKFNAAAKRPWNLEAAEGRPYFCAPLNSKQLLSGDASENA